MRGSGGGGGEGDKRGAGMGEGRFPEGGLNGTVRCQTI